MDIDHSDVNTVLAALRYYQQNGQCDPFNRSDEIHDIATGGGDDTSATSERIDQLCEAINLGELTLVETQ